MNACKLADKTCIPCSGGIPPLMGDALRQLSEELKNDWTVINGHQLEKEFQFKNFKDALAFTNRIGDLAEEQGHHPDIHLAWGSVKICLYTHKIDGLTEADFVLAAKIDTLPTEAQAS